MPAAASLSASRGVTVWRCHWWTGRALALGQAGLLIDADHVAERVADVAHTLAGFGVPLCTSPPGLRIGRKRVVEVGDHETWTRGSPTGGR